MPARHEQIGERAVHEQAMSVLRQSAIAHLDKAKHSLNDPDRMLDPGSHFRFGAVFRPLDLIDNTAVAIAAIGEIAGFGRMLSDYRATDRAIPCRRRHWPALPPRRGSASCDCLPRNAPSSRNTTDCPSSSGASRDRVPLPAFMV